jgi:hypothetical protein
MWLTSGEICVLIYLSSVEEFRKSFMAYCALHIRGRKQGWHLDVFVNHI